MAIEFRNNGVSDSLTNSISPTIFYSMLEREIALTLRKEVQLSIVTVEIPGANNDRQMFIANSGLKLCLRKGDFYSRIAVRGFWVCLRGNLKAAEDWRENIFLQQCHIQIFNRVFPQCFRLQ